MQGRATYNRLRALCGAFLALSALALAACSYYTNFVIVNDSGSPVEVRYTFKRGRSLERPSKKPLDKLGDDDAPWRPVGEGEFSYDPGAGAVTLTLGPGEALGVCGASNWGGHGDRGDEEKFDLESVRITGANGAVSYEGRQAQYQFQRVDANLYKLTYYGWGDKRHDGGS